MNFGVYIFAAIGFVCVCSFCVAGSNSQNLSVRGNSRLLDTRLSSAHDAGFSFSSPQTYLGRKAGAGLNHLAPTLSVGDSGVQCRPSKSLEHGPITLQPCGKSRERANTPWRTSQTCGSPHRGLTRTSAGLRRDNPALPAYTDTSTYAGVISPPIGGDVCPFPSRFRIAAGSS